MQREYTTPAGNYSRLYNEMLNQVHLLIAGATGSGKSTVVNGIMHAALFRAPSELQLVLIDPKGTELIEYRGLPHCISYAQTTAECINALQMTLDTVNRRFKAMQRSRQRLFNGPDICVVIDELMYLFNRPEIKKRAMQLLQDILVIARAARVHVIACTQNPTTATIPATLRCNFDSRIGLRTATAQDSRNVIGVRGCEAFPVPSIEKRAFGAVMIDGVVNVYNLQKIDDCDRARLIDYWTRNRKPKLKLFNRG